MPASNGEVYTVKSDSFFKACFQEKVSKTKRKYVKGKSIHSTACYLQLCIRFSHDNERENNIGNVDKSIHVINIRLHLFASPKADYSEDWIPNNHDNNSMIQHEL